ncbi:MAG: hypothetical protein QOD30_1516 [Actinomycetota bacterium]|nr:hypothetical protein [Actinomycetota bacterium]
MKRDDLDAIGWSGTASHVRNVAGQLDRRDRGVVEYLVVRDERGSPIAKGAIDYEEHPGAGTIMQLATRPDLEGGGLATMLIAEAERRIRHRGFSTATLSVEPENARARRLYEHLGYRPTGERTIGWEHELENGELGWYSTVVVDMEKRLAAAVAELLEAQRSFYDTDAVDYDAFLRSLDATENSDPLAVRFREGRARVTRFLRDHAPLGTVLDIASGTGLLSELVADADADKVVLLDPSETSLRLAAARLRGAACEVELVTSDVFGWDAAGARFDSVVFSSWLHHVPRGEVGSFFDGIERLLAPGGQVLFDFPTLAAAAATRPDEPPAAPSEEYSVYARDDGTGVRDHHGRRWTLVHELWSRDDLVAALDELGWTTTASTPSWWEHFEWLRLVRR